MAVTDGDTVTVEDAQGKRQRVRLWGIDAPEKDQPGGAAAANHLRDVALFQTVDVQSVARDKYARLLAVLVRREGWSVNGNMVRMGHAWAYGSPRWKRTETRAKNEHRGFWQCKNPVQPWQWRKANRPSQ